VEHPPDDTRPGVTRARRLEVGPTLRRWAGDPWVWPVPAVAIHALVLVLSDRVWSDMATVHSRTGPTTHMPVGERQLILVGAVCVFYCLAVLGGPSMFEGRARIGMRPSTLGERTVALWLVRLTLLATMYYATFWLVQTYVFG
jgi:hypothetical protein